MAWRFGAVEAESVMAVISDARSFGKWTVTLPPAMYADARWPQVGSIVRKETDHEPHGKHAYDRHLTIAVVEVWQPPQEVVLRVRSGLGGWIRLTITVQARPGGSLIEVRSVPLSAAARLRHSGPARARAEERCGAVAESLIRLASAVEAGRD